MPHNQTSRALSLAALLALGSPALAQGLDPAADPAEAGDDLLDFMVDLETQLNQTVVSSTKTAQRATRAPAVVTVITSEEIRARGYLSLAEVLRVVPGFYDVYDLHTHNVGVRGINGGARASGSILKLMIDGHPVDYRPTTGNFFGEELIPLPAVERVEVIRGPASALYGANAFLGVVNVITKKGAAVEGTRVTGYGGAVRTQPAGGGGLMIGGGSETLDVLVAAQALFSDRSGLELPYTSPALANEDSRLRDAGASQGDVSRPRSLFVKVSTSALAAGRLTLTGSLQSLETGGEFQDFAPLSHRTRLASVNQNYRLVYEAEPSEAVGLTFSAAYLHAQPSERERLDIGRPDVELLRRVGVHGLLFTGEARVQALEALQLTQGVDVALEQHTTQSFDQRLRQDIIALDGSVLRRSGTIVPAAEGSTQVDLGNVGAFVQAVYQATEDPRAGGWSARGRAQRLRRQPELSRGRGPCAGGPALQREAAVRLGVQGAQRGPALHPAHGRPRRPRLPGAGDAAGAHGRGGRWLRAPGRAQRALGECLRHRGERPGGVRAARALPARAERGGRVGRGRRGGDAAPAGDAR